ncbi:MarR family transcriptional regulator [Paenibacillus chibensis]|uniref:MarR family transcriptional regulator n=1 Tax=Paenibacillus chibensis TaxID=59846 RepID=A0ABU6PRA2_9BACL|nr:MarR family transcriptional regulator [Paenibacillus chibensis]MEC0372724.1 MarR family transcriptional regulator [Paenibacillus chibensis]MED5017414.1 MarR family transcriptional regulator [Paenibacillus chibensis]
MGSSVFDNIGVLIHTVDLEITQYLKRQLAPYQLAPEQHLILALLMEREGMSQNAIAEQLGKDKSSITRMIFSLEGKGYIRRLECSNDRRSVEVYLTDKGKELREAVNTIGQTTRELLSKGLTEEETSELRRLLGQVRENVRQV